MLYPAELRARLAANNFSMLPVRYRKLAGTARRFEDGGDSSVAKAFFTLS